VSDVSQDARWRETGRLAAAILVAAVIVALFFLALVETADAPGYPLGFVVAATGLPIALAAMVFWFIRRQEAIDRRHGLYED
jgi:putative solute:sodium symporter small subunit